MLGSLSFQGNCLRFNQFLQAILEFFEKFIYTISQDLQFAIDDISGEDTLAVGVTWHLGIYFFSH